MSVRGSYLHSVTPRVRQFYLLSAMPRVRRRYYVPGLFIGWSFQVWLVSSVFFFELSVSLVNHSPSFIFLPQIFTSRDTWMLVGGVESVGLVLAPSPLSASLQSSTALSTSLTLTRICLHTYTYVGLSLPNEVTQSRSQSELRSLLEDR